MRAATVAILLCSAPAFLTQPAGSMPGVRNQFNIETIGRKLKDTIAVDIQKNREILQELVDLQTNETEQMYKYIDEAIEKLSNATFFTLNEFKNNTEENLENMKTTMKENLESMNAKVDANDKKIVESIMGANGSALALTEDWMKARSEAIENIVSSRLSVCGHTQHHIPPGTVAYDNTLQSNTKEIRILGETMKWEDVFDLKRGEFTVPAGGAGEYLISAAVVMDVHSYQAKLNKDRTVMSQYRFLLNGHKELDVAPLYSDAGKDSEADLVQASRSIVWQLKDGESLALKKIDTRHALSPEAALDHRITFCVALLHLDEGLIKGLVSPPTKNNVELDDWKFSAPPAMITSTIPQPGPTIHLNMEPAILLPKALVSHDCSLTDTCIPSPSGTTSQPEIYTSNAP